MTVEKKALIATLEDSEKEIRLLKTEIQSTKKILKNWFQLSVSENENRRKNDVLCNRNPKHLRIATSEVHYLPYCCKRKTFKLFPLQSPEQCR